MTVMDDPWEAQKAEVQTDVMDDKRADPQRVKRADPQRIGKSIANCRQGLTRKNGCDRQTAGSSFRKGRSQDTVEGLNEDPGQGPG